MTGSRLFHAIVIMGCSLSGSACGGSSDNSQDPASSQPEGDAATSAMSADAGSDETPPSNQGTATDAAHGNVSNDGAASDDAAVAHDAGHAMDEDADAGWPPTK